MHNDPDTVTFANFSSLGLPGREDSQLLLVGYRTGLQIWDTTNLGEVKELVNVRDIGTVLMADVLPHPAESTNDGFISDEFIAERPLIGVVYVQLSPVSLLTDYVLSSILILDLNTLGGRLS